RVPPAVGEDRVGRAIKRWVRGATIVVCACLFAGCAKPRSTSTEPAAIFEDVTRGAGIDFVQDNGFSNRFRFVESNSGGVAVFDYDGDGDQDLYFVQSGSSDPAESVRQRPHGALYRNEGTGRFTDITTRSGLDRDLGYGHGVATGDIDNDGFVDLLVTGYRSIHLFRNEGGSGRFADITKDWGLDAIHGTGMAMSAAFCDFDNDRRLDLYVAYYGNWSHANDRACADAAGDPEYCTPELIDPDTHRLWRNTGSKFEDISRRAGIERKRGRGLAVAWLDADDDGRPDIFVANDLSPNLLWRGRGDGTFQDIAVEAGCAFNADGQIMAGMGVALGDIDHSGRESLYVTDFTAKLNALFVPVGDGLYEDRSRGRGKDLAETVSTLAFGTAFLDYDNDGWLDLVVNNGHVNYRIDRSPGGWTYKQPKHLFHNRGEGRFESVSRSALGPLATPMVGRGLATGDLDNDGRMDVVAVNQNAAPQVLLNRCAGSGHWVGFALEGSTCHRDAELARVYVTAGGARRSATVRGGSSYLSASDRRVLFGLGTATRIDKIEVRWPDGVREAIDVGKVGIDAYHRIVQGRGLVHCGPGGAARR
ncbi:MAG: CRTAC1 family protein, partial [Armatimonadota bacterium]